MIRRIVITSSFLAGIIAIGCSWAPGDDHPPQIYNDHYPNNGAYGPDATPYFPDASKDATIDADTETVEASTNCFTTCVAMQCGTVPNNCGSFITCTPCRDNEECVDNVCRLKVAACEPETDVAFCARYDKNCGPHTGLDNCGKERTVNACGGACAGVCVNNACCVSVALTCNALQLECGTKDVADNCNVIQHLECNLCADANAQCTDNKCVLPPPPPVE